jgi:hypothetical protein
MPHNQAFDLFYFGRAAGVVMTNAQTHSDGPEMRPMHSADDKSYFHVKA